MRKKNGKKRQSNITTMEFKQKKTTGKQQIMKIKNQNKSAKQQTAYQNKKTRKSRHAKQAHTYAPSGLSFLLENVRRDACRDLILSAGVSAAT